MVTAKETTPKTKEDLALSDAATEIMRLREENIKQKEDLLSDKHKVKAELTDENILLIVSRNYEKRLEKENEELQSRKEKELFDMQSRLELSDNYKDRLEKENTYLKSSKEL